MRTTTISAVLRRRVKTASLLVLLVALAVVLAGCGGQPEAGPTQAAKATATPAVVPPTSTAPPEATKPLPVHAGDRAALVALYNATDGANWHVNTNWLSDAPLGEWYGVTTNDEGRVTELNLANNRLMGNMPTELGSLANLTVLDLRGDFSSDDSNEMIGEIPAELGNLGNLRVLNLDDNQLTGEIPPELGNLAHLRVLNISHWSWDGCGYGQLTGEVPPELGSLVNLRQLRLTGNQLAGEIPMELGSLVNLGNFGIIMFDDKGVSGDISLDLSCNELTGEIPAELGDLTNLYWLRLNDNRLTGRIPAELGNLGRLSVLELSGNKLVGCIPPTLQDVKGLQDLGLPFCD